MNRSASESLSAGQAFAFVTICGFLRQIGGHVTLSSEAGKGTTVKMYLPHFAGSPPAAESNPDGVIESAGNGQTVLVIEDEDSLRMLIVEVLTELGYQAVQAANGDAAMVHLKSPVPIDLLITDVGLSGLNGRQVAEIARRDRPNLPVLFVTAYAANATVRATFLDPGMQMICKPFAVQELAVKVGEILKG